MMTHVKIISLLKDRRLPCFDEAVANVFELDDYLICRALFLNFRRCDSDMKGLRLSKLGLGVMSSCYQNWSIKMPDHYSIESLHLLYLDRTCVMPWYLSNYTLVLFEKQLAMRAKLTGSLNILMDAFGPL